jgi:hypothetical protein
MVTGPTLKGRDRRRSNYDEALKLISLDVLLMF